MSEEIKLQIARTLMSELLASGPMKAATLKIRMLKDFEERADEPFDLAFRKYPKFSAFLVANSDLLEVNRPAPGTGNDILVELRAGCSDASSSPVKSSSKSTGSMWRRPEVFLPDHLWKAFTTSMSDSANVFNRDSSELKVVGKSAVSTLGRSWLEIEPVTSADQLSWIAQFADNDQLPAGLRSNLRRIAGESCHSGQTNYRVDREAGDYKELWRNFRANSVFAHVQRWCDKWDVDPSKLLVPVSAKPQSSLQSPAEALRNALIHAISSASHDELRQIQIPSTLLLNARRHADAR